jgi:hypothetical protein
MAVVHSFLTEKESCTRATSAPHQPPARLGAAQRSSPSPLHPSPPRPGRRIIRREPVTNEGRAPLPSHPTAAHPSQSPPPPGDRDAPPRLQAAALPHPQRRHPNPSQGNRSHRRSPSSSLALHLRRRFGVPTCFCCPALP